MGAHTFNPNRQRHKQVELYELEAGQVYTEFQTNECCIVKPYLKKEKLKRQVS